MDVLPPYADPYRLVHLKENFLEGSQISQRWKVSEQLFRETIHFTLLELLESLESRSAHPEETKVIQQSQDVAEVEKTS